MATFFCEKCKRDFPRKNRLVYHQKHDVCREKQFECDQCGNFFGTKGNLSREKFCSEKL